VTGGAGFIGSNIVSELLKNGHQVVVIDNESAESHDSFYWEDNAENHKLDVCDYEKILPLFKDVDTVFHCAAEARIQPAIINPLQAVKTNSYGTCSVLQASRMMGVRRVIYSSTSSAYGHNQIPNVETQIEDCLTPYSVSKVSGEKLCKMYYELFGLETIVFRYFNVYGERQPLKGVYAPVVGKFLKQFKNNEPLTIVPDGENKRDYTHISDVVSANVHAINCEKGVYEVGSGEARTFEDVLDILDKKYDYHDENKIPSWYQFFTKSEKLKWMPGWKPKHNIESGVKKYKEYLDG